jgi:hypothetical protein
MKTTNDFYLDSLSTATEFIETVTKGRDLYITNGPVDGHTDISGCLVYCMTSHPLANDLESFVYNKPHAHNWLHAAPQIEQIWLPDHYKEYKSYVETVYKKPVVIIPSHKIPEPCASPSYTPDTLLDIVLFDTNDAFHRSSYKALYICEELYARFPAKVGTVFLLNMPENDTAYKLIESFCLRKDKKLRIFKGLRTDQIISFFRANKNRSVFLSNSVLPEITPFMNTLVANHLPLVHTRKDFPFGDVYEMNDIETCIRLLTEHMSC